MTFWQTPSFKALQEVWYQRLKAEGFQDAEEIVGGELVLRQSAAHPYRHHDELGITAKEAYYRLLAQQVQVAAEFQTEVDRVILTMFAEGAKLKKIAEELEKRGERRCRGTIRYRIRTYEMRWGLREYTPKQLNKKVG